MCVEHMQMRMARVALALVALLACAGPVYGSGHGHAHKRRTGGLLQRLRGISTKDNAEKQQKHINSAVSAALAAVRGHSDVERAAPSLRSK